MSKVPATVETPAEVSSLVALALREKVPVEVLERLVALQERVTQRDAEMAMAQALAKFQQECPSIRRVKTAAVSKNGVKQYEYHFAPLDEVARVIRPFLAKNGLSYTHDRSVTANEVEVICTLQHSDGAKRTATFRGPIDTSGGKNPIQQVASAGSYGRRYSLMDVLGLTTEDDDDGHGAGGGGTGQTISESQEADLGALMREVGVDERRFLAWLKKSVGVEKLSEIPVERYAEVVQALEQKRRAS